MLESLASGTPVLAFDCAAAGEFILHDKNGWLVPIDEPDRYIQNALNITAEKDRLSKTRTFARSSVEHLGWHEIAGQVESIFQRAIEIG